MSKLYIGIVVITAVSALSGGAVGFVIDRFAFPTPAVVQVDPREQYYRGIYDVCRAAVKGTPDQCLETIGKLIEKSWYEEESKGWTWSGR